MNKNMITKLLREADVLLEESNKLNMIAEKYLEDGNELEWEDSKIESVNKAAYARGIKYALEKLEVDSL